MLDKDYQVGTNPEMSAWAEARGKLWFQVIGFSIPRALCSAVFARICCLPSVHSSSSHPFPSITAYLWAIIDLKDLDSCLYLNLFVPILTQVIWVMLSCPLPCHILCPSERHINIKNHFCCDGPREKPSHWFQPAPFYVPSACVAHGDIGP